MDELDRRGSLAVDHRPRKSVSVIDSIDELSAAVLEIEKLSFVRESSAKRADHRVVAESFLHHGRISGDDQVLSHLESRSAWKGIRYASRKAPVREIHGRGVRVVQLEELLGPGEIDGRVVDLVDDDARLGTTGGVVGDVLGDVLGVGLAQGKQREKRSQDETGAQPENRRSLDRSADRSLD